MSEVNLLDLIPKRVAQFEESSDGLVTILKPKFSNRLMVKYVLPRLKNPNFKVNLDQFGSFVWKLCDGTTTVEQIGRSLKENFQQDIEPLYERLSVFIQSLVRYRFLAYTNLDNNSRAK